MILAADNLAVVEAQLHALQWIAADERLLALESAGAGNMNITLRARLPERSLILKQSRPYVARYPQIEAPIERSEVEAAFYQAVAADVAVASHMPELIGYDRDNHLLALTDLGPAADYSRHYNLAQTDTLPITQLLQWLAALHALPLETLGDRKVFDNKKMRILNHEHIFQIPLTANNTLSLADGLDEIAAQFAGDKALTTHATELGKLYLSSEQQAVNRLLHGDYYPGSWLQQGKRICVIDVEFSFIGPIEFDLGVFLAHCIMTGTDVEEAALLLADYPAAERVNESLALSFAGIEIIRRLLGVAQLPLAASSSKKLQWLDWSREKLLS